ncbi:GATA zinc finger domain-containing protein [Heracleum sosnowskyi]|uniref:GATA zinc finger domain-containing protein n=1 Tax=Heracleum sosnowskyi TaxID=360622 RepID=A0AAD8IKW3_9APIA|nr:GATA zinc finger domain-containing protein [Heracleum sosnowskyi]
MPGLTQNNDQFSSSVTTSLSGSVNGFWSKHRAGGGDISYNQLHKFWSELSLQARQQLLKIDKQTLFEQTRKNMYCSRCNGLLLEGFLQIVMYGKSLLQDGAVVPPPLNRVVTLKSKSDGDLCVANGCQDDLQDPSVHPWGGLTTSRDGTLTLLDCYLYSKSLKGIQIVFDSARARERERELLYPDACGGGGRGWISQAMTSYGRGHGTRETCALHTARLSVDTLVDFWSALGDETRQSLLRMKEEDFIERLMYRFDSKRFCRDCRRNVIREFKELKELKRIRREPRCTSWFCGADTSFQYEVSHDTVQADWHQTFLESFATYHHFEWAVGTGEGKSDILEFENVGLSGRVQVNGLDLCGLNACYITLRAWKMDGRCTELSVKAHALKGQQCVHCRLVVGDGFVTITRGESIRRFFEHAEEAEEEEDDDSMDKDGNDLDGDCSRPQKHAKSPELAREFLLDAATVIFKEQVEKAFREGTARQNAHSIFVSLALKLLEERIHVACKEIVTLEKQTKLLEEEEKEKREEEERKERRRMKEKEKKLRRKERIREKEKDKGKNDSETDQHVAPDVTIEELTPNVEEEPNITGSEDLINSETGDVVSSRLASPDIEDEHVLDGYHLSSMQNNSVGCPDDRFATFKDESASFGVEHSNYSHQKLKHRKDFQLEPKRFDRRRFPTVSENVGMNNKLEQNYQGNHVDTSRTIIGPNKQSRCNAAKTNPRTSGSKFAERLHGSNRMSERDDFHSCSCYQHNDYRTKIESHRSARTGRDGKVVCKSESSSDVLKPYNRGIKYTQVDHTREGVGRPKTKYVAGSNSYSRDSHHTKQVWEPMESQKKYVQSTSYSDVTMRSTFEAETTESHKQLESSGAISCDAANVNTASDNYDDNEKNCQGGFHFETKSSLYLKKEVPDEEADSSPMTSSSLTGTSDPSMSSTSNSDSCSSCLSEGDSNGSSSNPPIPEISSASDSDDASQHSERREQSRSLQNSFHEHQDLGMESKQSADCGQHFKSKVMDNGGNSEPGSFSMKLAQEYNNGMPNVSNMNPQPHGVLPPLHSQSIHYPLFQPASIGYYHQTPVSWPAASNGLVALPHRNHYVFPSPFRYDINGNSHFVPYSSLPHMPPPILNTASVPVYQPVSHINDVNSKVRVNKIDFGGVKEAHQEVNIQAVTKTEQYPVKNVELEPDKRSRRDSEAGNAGFSLFHCGGPVALANGYKAAPLPPKEAVGHLSFSKSSDHIAGDQNLNKDNAVEEYNLFAASNGLRFSFF